MSYPAPSGDLAGSDPRPAPSSEEKLDRLRTLLREMFQLDRGDLDFGLYRIMNLKAGEIHRIPRQRPAARRCRAPSKGSPPRIEPSWTKI